MANLFVALPVPPGDGVGAWVDTSTLGPTRTITVDGGAFAGQLLIEGSNDAAATAAPVANVPIFTGGTSNAVEFTATLQFMRVRRQGSSAGPAGTPDVTVGGPLVSTNIFGSLAVPAGDGVGAPTALSGGGSVNTFQATGSFTGQVFLEVSNDGVNFSTALIFTAAGAAGQTFIGVVKSARVRRRFSTGGAAPAVSVGSGGTSESGTSGGDLFALDLAALSAIDISQLTTGAICRVQTLKDFFFLDEITVRVAVADEVVASPVATAWWVRMQISDPYWQDQATWVIDPINGNDENEGDVLADAIQTRTEYARRTDGTPLRANTDVRITSDLLLTDTRIPHRPSTGLTLGGATGFSIRYHGDKVAIANGGSVLTAVVNRNGATGQATQLTAAGLTGTWTALGLVGKVIEGLDGGGNVVRAVVEKDLEGTLGTRTAQVSPPLTAAYAQGATFGNGTAFQVYRGVVLSNVKVQPIAYDYAEFDYCDAAQWQWFGNYNDYTNCGGTQLSVYGGTTNLRNNAIQTISMADGICQVTGGFAHFTISAGCGLRVVGHAGIRMGAAGSSGITNLGGVVSTSGPGPGQPSDLEFVDANPPFLFTTVNNGAVTCDQYCYGNLAAGTTIVNFGTGARDSRISFAQLPSFGGSTGLNFTDAGWVGSTANLSTAEVSDAFNNRVLGPAGPSYAMLQTARLLGLGILSETFDRVCFSSATVLVGTGVTGTVYYTTIPLLAGMLVTNLAIGVGAAAVLPVVSKVGLYDAAGNRLALSADQGVSWATAGLKTIGMIAPYRVLTTGLYYAAILSIATTTPATIMRGSTGNFGATSWMTGIGAGQIPFGTQTGQADLPNPGVIAAALTSLAHYFAVT